MTGLDKILKQIQTESDAKVNEIISAANQKADEIVSAANESAQNTAAQILEKADKDAAALCSRAESANAINMKNSILLKKQELIKTAVENARKYLCDLPEKEYFEVILKMVKKYAPEKNGVIMFNKTDLARLPQGFENEINKALGSDSAALKISDTAVDIDGGFVLGYGGVEENCGFKALFESAADELSDKAYTLLFS